MICIDNPPLCVNGVEDIIFCDSEQREYFS